MALGLKFWQKTFLCVIVCFLIGFDVAAYLIVQKSYEMSSTNEISTAENEYYTMRKSLSERLSSVSRYYTSLNADNIQQYITAYCQYYAGQSIYIAIYQNDALVFSNFSGGLPQQLDMMFTTGEKYIQFRNVDGRQYLMIASYLDVSETDLVFVYIKDEENLVTYRRDIAGYAIKTGTAVSIGLAAVIVFMLLKLTRPVRELNKAAKEISSGNYKKRAIIKSRDEIGEFSELFNSMANHIEAHIEMLSRITEEKQRFIDNLSHEMRTPIAAVLGYGELIKNAGIGQEEFLLATNYIIGQSLRLQSLSSKLLQLSSMQNDAISMEPLLLSDITRRAISTLCHLIKEKNIYFQVNLMADGLHGDSDLLESLFQNLFENAARALGQHGIIKIHSEYAGDSIRVTIKDNGPGMPQTELEKIFEPFYRVDKARNRTHGGAGLGLSICKQICAVHGAELSIASSPKNGTAVQILFTNPKQLHDDLEI